MLLRVAIYLVVLYLNVHRAESRRKRTFDYVMPGEEVETCPKCSSLRYIRDAGINSLHITESRDS